MRRMDSSTGLEEAVQYDERDQFVQNVVARLSEKRKKIILLNIYEGKSYQEIAEMMKISKNTVKNQLVKAKQILREQLVAVYI